jgi:hypothetical protein
MTDVLCISGLAIMLELHRGLLGDYKRSRNSKKGPRSCTSCCEEKNEFEAAFFLYFELLCDALEDRLMVSTITLLQTSSRTYHTLRSFYGETLQTSTNLDFRFYALNSSFFSSVVFSHDAHVRCKSAWEWSVGTDRLGCTILCARCHNTPRATAL